MNFFKTEGWQTVRDKVLEIDYSWKKPASYLVLVPVISAIVQKIKVSYLEERIEAQYPQPLKNANVVVAMLSSKESKELDQVNTWHAIGAAVQAVFLTLLTTQVHHLFIFPLALASYQIWYSVCHLNRTIHIQNP